MLFRSDSVLEREAMGGTDFGHLVAIPHPADNLVNEHVVCVGILDMEVNASWPGVSRKVMTLSLTLT